MIATTPTIASNDPAPDSPSELELLKMDVIGRVRIPAEKREAILDAFERSGMSGQAFAAKWGLKYPTFATWVQKRRRARDEYPEAKKAQLPPKALSLVEAVIDTGAADASLEVETPGGVKLRLSRREDIALAVELLRALQSSESC